MLALFWEIGAGRVKVRPAPKAAPESLENSGLLYPQCSRITPGISAYIPAVSSALRPWSRPRSSSAAARPGERAARRQDRAGFPGRAPRYSARPPALGSAAGRPPGSICNRPPSSTSPAYSTHSPKASIPFPGHSWRTISLQGSG